MLDVDIWAKQGEWGWGEPPTRARPFDFGWIPPDRLDTSRKESTNMNRQKRAPTCVRACFSANANLFEFSNQRPIMPNQGAKVRHIPAECYAYPKYSDPGEEAPSKKKHDITSDPKGSWRGIPRVPHPGLSHPHTRHDDVGRVLAMCQVGRASRRHLGFRLRRGQCTKQPPLDSTPIHPAILLPMIIRTQRWRASSFT